MTHQRRGRAGRSRRRLVRPFPLPLALALVAIVAGYIWWQRLPVAAPEVPGSAPVALVADRHAKGSATAPVLIEEWGDFG